MNQQIKTALPFLIGVICLGIGAAIQPDTPARQSPLFWVFAASFAWGFWNMWSGVRKSAKDLEL